LWGYWCPAHDLLNDSCDIRELFSVLKNGKSVFAHNIIDFCMGPLLYLRIEHHGENERYGSPCCLFKSSIMSTHKGDAKRSYGIHPPSIDCLAAPLDDFFLVGVDRGPILWEEV
jgi:hypothetical protein